MAGSGAMFGAFDVGLFITKSENGARKLTIHTEDTFATACYFLGMTPSPRIDGKPLREILRLDELLQAGR